jgi:hypothetical protein
MATYVNDQLEVALQRQHSIGLRGTAEGRLPSIELLIRAIVNLSRSLNRQITSMR